MTIVPLSILVITLGMQVYLHSFWLRDDEMAKGEKMRRGAWFLFALLVVLSLALRVRAAWLQYSSWRMDPLAKFFLPPYQSASYFASYVGSRIFASWIVALLAAFAVFFALRALNRAKDERFFEPAEPVLAALAVLASGYPGFIFYILGMALISILWTAAFQILRKGRAPLYFLWLPVAILGILIVYWLVPPELITTFNI